MYSHAQAYAQPFRPTSSMSYGPVIPCDPRSASRRPKSSQGFMVSSSSTWPRSHDMHNTAAVNRPPLQPLTGNSWSQLYKSHQSQPRHPYPQQPPSAYRYPPYPQTQTQTKDMFHNFQLNPPPPLANFRDPDALSASWIGPDGQQKDWNMVEREEELMRRKSTRSSVSSSRQQPPLTNLTAGYPANYNRNVHQPAVHAPGGPGGFVNPQQVNAYANHAPAGPSHNRMTARPNPQNIDEYSASRPPPILNDFGSWPGKLESTLRWDLTDPTRISYHNGRSFRSSQLQHPLFTEPLTRIYLSLEPATKDYSLRPHEFSLASLDNKPFTIGSFIQAMATFLTSKIPATVWHSLPKTERHEVIKAWWRRTKTEAPMTWTENNDALIVNGYTGFPMMDLLGQYVIFTGLAKPKGYEDPKRWMLKSVQRPLK